MRRLLRNLSVAALVLPAASAMAAPASFESPQAAVDALIGALNAADRERLLEVFGPENEDVVLSGEEPRDREDWSAFLAAFNEMHRLVEEDDGREQVLEIGTEQWPFPIPLKVGADGAWAFDTDAGAEEIRARRIGENELAVIDLMRDYVRVQAAFRQIDYDGDGIMEFATAILSDPGERNGLYWPSEPGEPESPIGDFVARAAASGYSVDGAAQEPEPYLGYYYKLLDKQGESAPGGAYDYKINDQMVSGHALLAFPSAYGDTGIMSFMVGENGVIFEADLGEDTIDRAAGIDAYDPADPWFTVE